MSEMFQKMFHTCSNVNQHNGRSWTDKRPNDFMVFHEIIWSLICPDRDSPKVSVWLGMVQFKIYEPFFFQENISNRYHLS